MLRQGDRSLDSSANEVKHWICFYLSGLFLPLALILLRSALPFQLFFSRSLPDLQSANCTAQKVKAWL